MAEEGKKAASSGRISERERLRYIGFDVFPGKPKDLFRSDAERQKHVEAILAKRKKGQILRDHCSLFEERVSVLDRLVLTVASLVIVTSLFLPWFAVSNTIIEEVEPGTPSQAEVAAELDSSAVDSLAMAGVASDSAVSGAAVEPDQTTGAEATTGDSAVAGAAIEPGETTDEEMSGEETAVGATEGSDSGVVASVSEGRAEQVIHGYVAVKKKIHKEYSRVSGIGMFASLGSVGSKVFSSGVLLIVTAIFVLVYALLCLALPAYTLYSLFGQKGHPDERALKLKRVLRLNWMPIVLFVVMFILSFFGAEYGFDPAIYDSIGDSYSVAAFLGSLTWGVLLTLSAFTLVAVKGVEI